LSDISCEGKELITYGFQKGLARGIYQSMAEEAHEIIGHNNEISAGFTGPKVMQVELVDEEIMFEFFDAVLRIRSPPIEIIDYADGKGEIGDITTVAIVTQLVIIREELQLSLLNLAQIGH
jgi:hypothetical protein